MQQTVQAIGILGAGKLGITLAQLARHAGYRVYIAGSGNPAKIRMSVDVLAPGAESVTAETAAKQADIAILALPLGKYHTIPVEALNGKLVIDAMNYWWEVDGARDDLIDITTPTSMIIQRYLPQSIVVKAFNHMGYHNLHDETKPTGEKGRKAIAVAGDNRHAVAIVSQLIDALGFDTIHAGTLANSKRLEPGSDVFGANVDATRLQTMLDNFSIDAMREAVKNIQAAAS